MKLLDKRFILRPQFRKLRANKIIFLILERVYMSFRRLPPVMSLRAFEAVARHGSFKQAADELSVTPGALSQQVKNLEESLGVKLFVRKNREISTTPEGEKLKLGLIDGFSLIRRAIDSIQPTTGNPQLVVTCGPPFAAKWLALRLPIFLEHHNHIDVHVKSGFKIEDLSQNQFDVGIRFSQDTWPGLHNEALGNEAVMAVASPGFVDKHQISDPRDMLRVPLLTEESMTFCPNAPTWREWFQAAGLNDQNYHRGLNFGVHAEQAIDAALSGGGVLLARKTLVSHDLLSGRLVCLFDKKIDTSLRYSLVCSFDKLQDPNVNAFSHWVKTAFYEQQLV